MSTTVESPTPRPARRMAPRWQLLIVMMLALLLRLLAAVLVEHHVQLEGRTFFVEGDANGYWHLGKAIAAGEDYAIHLPPRRVLRVPGFPLLLAASIYVFGDHVFPARCVLAAVGVCCCWMTWLLGKRLVTRRVGFWAAVLMAVHPLQIGNSVLILSESWFTFWMLAGLLALVQLIDGSRGIFNKTSRIDIGLPGRSALTGGLIAIAVLVRPGFIPWIVVAVAGVLLFQKRSWGARWTVAAVMTISFGAVMLPWIVRNYRVTGHWVVTSLWSGPSLYDGLNPQADGSSNMKFFDHDNVMATMSEYEMNAHYQQLAFEYVRENPGAAVVLAGRKVLNFLQPVPASTSTEWAFWAACGTSGVLMVALCLAGIRTRLLDSVGLLVVLGPFLLFLGVHMVFVGSLRYRLPAEFPLAILAAAGLCQWLPARKPG